MGMLPPVFVELRAMIGQYMRSMETAKGEMDRFERKTGTSMGGFKKSAMIAGAAGTVLTGALVDIGAHAVESAMKFQQVTNTYRTTAHETAAGYKVITNGILDLAGKVGYSSQDLAQAGYYVESMGHHGADGLNVLSAAAMGAKAENADLSSTVRAVTALMFDYRGSNVTATQATNTLTQAVGLAGTNFQDFAEALPRVSSAAQLANIPMADLTAALATMTRTGLPANVAATYLRSSLTYLVHPTKASTKALQAFGINADLLSYKMQSGNGGLAGAIQMVYDHVKQKLGPGILDAADKMVHGKMSVADFENKLKDLPPGLHTTLGAVAAMSGGIKSMMGALILGGPHQKEFNANTREMEKAVGSAGNKIIGFDLVQKTAQFQIDRVKDSIDAMGKRIGLTLLPAVTKIAKAIADFITKLNPKAVMIFLGVLGALAVGMMGVGAVALGTFISMGMLIGALVAIASGAVVAGITYLIVHFKGVRDAIKNAAEKVKEFAIEGAAWLKHLANEVAHSKFVAWLKHEIPVAASQAKAFLVTAFHAIITACQWVGKEATALWRGAIHPAFNAIVNFIRGDVVPIFLWLWHNGGDAVRSLAKIVMAVIPFVIATFRLLVTFVTGVLLPVIKLIWAVAQPFLTFFMDLVKIVVSVVLSVLGNLVSFILGTLVHTFFFLWDGVVRPVFTLIRDFIVDALRFLTDAFNAFADIFSGNWKRLGADMEKVGKDTWRIIEDIFKNALKLVGDILQQGILAALHILAGLVHLFLNVGKAIVMGLVNGIKDLAMLPVHAVSGMVKGVIGAVGGLLHINSPSKVFQAFGHSINEGLVLGLNDSAHTVHAKMAEIAKGVTNTKFVLPGIVNPGIGGLNYMTTGSGMNLGPGSNRLTLIVNAQVDRKTLFTTVQEDALRYARSNGKTNAFSLNK